MVKRLCVCVWLDYAGRLGVEREGVNRFWEVNARREQRWDHAIEFR